ncbi:hypothetical protein E3G69_004528 [Mycobacteroides abscessus]|nr:hypothetical protein [Mycobacteroides abscessus]QOF45470.1 hypothetical protein E3G69_004528 [Mycobacteroides abscessus]QOF50169.1 hypothetical protein E3G70_004527 [Mycobacteroides abscessus]
MASGCRATREALEHIEIQLGEGGTGGVVEVRDIGDLPVRIQRNLIRPAGEGRYERRPLVVRGDNPGARSPLGGKDFPEKIGAVLFSVSIDVGQDAGCFGGDERIGVDLSVRMCQGDADLLAVVLKAVDLLNPVDRTQFLCTLGPHINDQAGAARL